MWLRDEAQPTLYGGVQFRSALEACVAEQFDVLGVDWLYEAEPCEALSRNGSPLRVTGYLPDFTIINAPKELELTTWVEVKPASLLYAVRDHLGCPERFDDDFTSDIDASQLHAANLTEIWKPKKLAEVSGQAVLVVYQINRSRTLSILMSPDRVVLSRHHPAVNHRRVMADMERERRETQWREQVEAEARKRKERILADWIDYVRQNGRPARYGGRCVACGNYQPAATLLIARARDGAWVAMCESHLNESRGA